MINANLNNLRVVDDELFNRIIAFGPGDGINRVSVTVEDASSISRYGLRERVETFVDATSRDNLQTLATAFLDDHKEPVTEMEVTFFFDASDPELESILYEGEAVLYGGEPVAFWRYGDPKDVRRGDTVRIVAQSLGLNTTGVIEELSWEPGAVTLTIGKKKYNLLDVINGPEIEDERGQNALGLSVPIGFRAQRASPGVRVFVNPYTNSRASGVEIYASSTAGYTPDNGNLLVRGSATEFYFPELASGVIWYFRARSYDQAGNVSDFTDEVPAVSGYVDGGRIEEGSITDLTPFASALQPPKLVLSLPVVPDPDYEIGDLVAFDGDLYELVSETGVPATDWQLLADLTELDGRLVANRLVSAQIEAGAIRAEQIAANAVTADKMLVNGTVTVANEDTAQDGAFVVLDGTSTEVLRLGAGIDGKPGVPSGVDYGLWGAAGTGLFFQGYGRVVTAVTWPSIVSTWNFPTVSSLTRTTISRTHTSDEVPISPTIGGIGLSVSVATGGFHLQNDIPSGWSLISIQAIGEAYDDLTSSWDSLTGASPRSLVAVQYSAFRVRIVARYISVGGTSSTDIIPPKCPAVLIAF